VLEPTRLSRRRHRLMMMSTARTRPPRTSGLTRRWHCFPVFWPAQHGRRSLLERITSSGEQSRRAPGPKLLALLDWNVAATSALPVQLGGATPTRARALDRPPLDRVHEYATRNATWAPSCAPPLTEPLTGIFPDGIHGGMSEPPARGSPSAPSTARRPVSGAHSVGHRAAREGVNFRGTAPTSSISMCHGIRRAGTAKRAGGIDPSARKEVRCHYFFYPQRAEDTLLQV